MTIAAINGQSGAGMMYMHLAFPPCSDSAARIVRLSFQLHVGALKAPRKSARWELEQFDTEQLLRRLAAEYIADACLDLDALAWASKEAAAGRQARAPKARSAWGAAALKGVTCL